MALEGGEGLGHALAALNTRKDTVPIVQETWWVPGAVWTGADNLTPPPLWEIRTRTVQPVASRYTD